MTYKNRRQRKNNHIRKSSPRSEPEEQSERAALKQNDDERRKKRLIVLEKESKDMPGIIDRMEQDRLASNDGVLRRTLSKAVSDARVRLENHGKETKALRKAGIAAELKEHDERTRSSRTGGTESVIGSEQEEESDSFNPWSRLATDWDD